jgi:hypothetical protein
MLKTKRKNKSEKEKREKRTWAADPIFGPISLLPRNPTDLPALTCGTTWSGAPLRARAEYDSRGPLVYGTE